MSANQEKLFAGARLRRLRKELGQTQAQFAESLNVSPSYLNLLERNQRPVTARVLLSLAEAFDVDVRAPVEEDEPRAIMTPPRSSPPSPPPSPSGSDPPSPPGSAPPSTLRIATLNVFYMADKDAMVEALRSEPEMSEIS